MLRIHIQHTSQTTKSDAGPARLPNARHSSHRDETASLFSHKSSSPSEDHPRALRAAIDHRPGNAREVKQDDPRFERLGSICSIAQINRPQLGVICLCSHVTQAGFDDKHGSFSVLNCDRNANAMCCVVFVQHEMNIITSRHSKVSQC